MSRKSFHKGLEFYTAGNYQEALCHFNKAVDNGGQNLYQILDTRAAVHAKLGQHKDALKDAKKVIDVAPEQWQGYARAARVFFHLNKADAAQTMITMALERLRETETERRASLLSLQADVHGLRNALEVRRKQFTDHISQLPIEIFGEIARLLVEDDHAALFPLLHVCKRWRKVIEDSPHLWTKLVLTSRRPKAKAKLWVARTNGRVKELFVTNGAACSLNWPGNSLDGLQWDGLVAFYTEAWMFLSYLRSIGKEAAMSKWTRLSVEGTSALFSLFVPLHRRLGPFSLQCLSLSRMSVDVTKLCDQIKDLRSCTIRDCYAMLGSWARFFEVNPLLERLELQSANSADKTPLPKTLELDHLTTLTALSWIPIEIFKARMPHLRSLTLDCPWYDPDIFIRHLMDTLVEGLTELKLHSCRLGDSTILLLRQSPNLQILEVTNLEGGVASLLTALAAHYTPPSSSKLRVLPDDPPTDPPPILCPKLTHLNFSGCSEVQAGLLMRLIKSRLIGDQALIAKIESLIIDFCLNVEKEWVKRMEELVPHVSCRYTTKAMTKGRILV